MHFVGLNLNKQDCSFYPRAWLMTGKNKYTGLNSLLFQSIVCGSVQGKTLFHIQLFTNNSDSSQIIAALIIRNGTGVQLKEP